MLYNFNTAHIDEYSIQIAKSQGPILCDINSHLNGKEVVVNDLEWHFDSQIYLVEETF